MFERCGTLFDAIAGVGGNNLDIASTTKIFQDGCQLIFRCREARYEFRTVLFDEQDSESGYMANI